jgi:acylphosphatase
VTAVRLVVHGRVQGVGFRYTVRREAQSAGVSGWVRNRSDGAVEAMLEGDDRAVQAVADFCERGPSSASVERVEREDVEPEGAEGFAIR